MEETKVIQMVRLGEEGKKEVINYKRRPTEEEARVSISKVVKLEEINPLEVRELVKELVKGNTIVLGEYVWYLEEV